MPPVGPGRTTSKVVLSHPHRGDPLPIEALRDLLGIARATYRAQQAGAGDPVRLQELVDAGQELALALKLAAAPPGSLGRVAAWKRAQQGTDRLTALVGGELTAASLVDATARRVHERK